MSFEIIEEDVDKIEYYLKHEEARQKIPRNGYIKARSIIDSILYWVGIDLALGKYSLTYFYHNIFLDGLAWRNTVNSHLNF